jgi:hypothetical protein
VGHGGGGFEVQYFGCEDGVGCAGLSWGEWSEYCHYLF